VGPPYKSNKNERIGHLDVGPSVQDTLALVYRLQTIDSELAHINQEIEAAKENLQKKEEGLKTLKSLMESEKSALLLLSKEKREKEDELRTNESIISENKKKNKELKHSREIQAYLSEMEFRRDEAERLQEEIIRLIDNQESLEKAIKNRESEVLERQREIEEDRRRTEEFSDRQKGQIIHLDHEKSDLLEQFPEPLFLQYSRLRSSHRNGLVVSRIQNGTCEVCRMTLPPRTLTEVKKKLKIVPCLHCQRWLYLEGTPDQN